MVEDPIFKSGLGRRATQTHRLTNQHILGVDPEDMTKPCAAAN